MTTFILTSTNAFLYVKILFWITVHQVALLFTIQSKPQNVTLFLFSAREMISVPLLMLDNGVCLSVYSYLCGDQNTTFKPFLFEGHTLRFKLI